MTTSTLVEQVASPRGYGEPFVPAGPLLDLVKRLRPDHSPRDLFVAWGISGDTPSQIERGRQRWVSFDVADRIVTYVLADAGLWQREPFLAAVYEAESD